MAMTSSLPLCTFTAPRLPSAVFPARSTHQQAVGKRNVLIPPSGFEVSTMPGRGETGVTIPLVEVKQSGASETGDVSKDSAADISESKAAAALSPMTQRAPAARLSQRASIRTTNHPTSVRAQTTLEKKRVFEHGRSSRRGRGPLHQCDTEDESLSPLRPKPASSPSRSSSVSPSRSALRAPPWRHGEFLSIGSVNFSLSRLFDTENSFSYFFVLVASWNLSCCCFSSCA